MKNKSLQIAYEILIGTLALISVVLLILDFSSKIAISSYPFYIVDNAILIVFTVDYIVRLYLSPKKIQFFKHNIFDLLAIIPFDHLFAVFRLSRIFRILKLTKFTKLLKATKFIRFAGFIGIAKKKLNVFLNTNGFICMLYASGGLILTSSVLMMFIEGQSFPDALWWSIVTCTTVGYGDISPATGLGRVVAVILMIFGIGFIGMLTGTITTFFANKVNAPKENGLRAELKNAIDNMSDDELVNLSKFIDYNIKSI